MCGFFVYEDECFNGFDVVILVEVIEYVEVECLDVLECVVFVKVCFSLVFVLILNIEFN